jgi:hypothetical protein
LFRRCRRFVVVVSVVVVAAILPLRGRRLFRRCRRFVVVVSVVVVAAILPPQEISGM